MFAFDDVHCDEGAASVRPGDIAEIASHVVRVLSGAGGGDGAAG
ncbi:hypothetical protein ABTZ58_19095 [Streptomyces sp. NPDC094143]